MYLKNRVKKVFQNDFWRKLAKNVTTVLVGNGGSSIINFFITLIMVHSLGNTKFGIFLLALQYMNVIDGVVNFQSWAGVIKYGGEALVEEDDDKLHSIIKCGYTIDVVTAVLGGFVAFLLVPAVCRMLGWSSELEVLAWIFSAEIIFHLEGTSVGVLRLYDRFNLTSIQSIVSALIKLILIGGYVLFGGKSMIIITVLYMIADIIKHLMLVGFAISVLKEQVGLHNLISASYKRLDKGFLKYTLWNNIASTVDVPVKYFDVFIIGFISVEMVAIYKVFRQVLQVLQLVIHPISQAIMPQLSELVARHETGNAYKKTMKLHYCLLGVGAVAIILAVLFGKLFFGFFFGAEYAAEIILFVVLLFVDLYSLSYVWISPLYASLGLPISDFVIALIVNVSYCIGAYFLVGTMGIYAIATASFISKLLHVNIRRFIIKSKIKEESVVYAEPTEN